MHNAPMVNIHLEFQTRRTVEQHKSFSRHQSQMSQAQPLPPPVSEPATQADNRPRPLLRPRLRASDRGRARQASAVGSSATQVAAVPAPSSGISRAQTNKAASSHTGGARLDVEAASRSGSAGQATVVKCASCDGAGHEAAACVKPTRNYGSIRGCTICNTRDHHLDDCGVVKDLDTSKPSDVEIMLEQVLHKRANKPQSRTANWAFYDVLSLAFTLQLVKPRYPWSNEFSKKIFSARSDDPILQGKVHPRNFVHGKHTEDDLPSDP